MKKNNILCIQISNTLINDIDLSKLDINYYEKLYKKRNKNGYYKGRHFWEVPLWVTEIDFNLSVDFYICQSIMDTVNYILDNKYKYVCFSVLDVNKDIIKAIVQLLSNTNITFILGGYINFKEYFKHCNNVKIFESIKAFIEFLGLEYKQGNNYRLFKGFKVIPRLTLSTGCLNNCDFCTVEKTLKKTPTHIIELQIEAFKPLDFKLVYINDKTFFQASNYKLLSRIYKAIKAYNKRFDGFIIQTTTGQLLKIDNKIIKSLHIKFIELGIESFNNDILRKYHKPSSESLSLKAAAKIRELKDIYFIPNIIIGIPEENKHTYTKTLNYLIDNKDIISHLNIYNLAVYDKTPLSKRLKHNDQDKNENILIKSFHKDKNIHEAFFKCIFELGISLLSGDL